MLATNAAYPNAWFRDPNFQPVATEERKQESGGDVSDADEKIHLVPNGSGSMMPQETIELEAQVFDTGGTERGNLGEIFATQYRFAQIL